ncbi:E3 ubiquitin-protein ligase LRSAM1-like [Dendronephthya gigantea]|uniref:E3 ubiquitin-protein ligase LRSAM1-like n=1 Tax=Dendronephthya gigantea TaxID=151771 RepID=UPI001069FCC4|nr:E3 ubiquitin-protein ligase LRSAM1-like [Dendronephthya gigantea]
MPLFRNKKQAKDENRNKKQAKDENRGKIERKLVLAQDDPEPTFDLSSCEAKEVPEKVYSLCKVIQKEVLLLHDNLIRDLKGGGDLKNLSQLRVLDLHKNLLSELPDEIRFLTSLQVLNLSHNCLKSIPKGIECLQSLQTFDLQENKLKVLPDEIGKMKSLRTLNISHNKVTNLPVSLANVRTLENLIVDVDTIIFPSKESAAGGTVKMMKELCAAAGIEYIPPSKCLLPVLDSGMNSRFPEVNSLQEDKSIENKIEEMAKGREKKFEMLAVEQQIRQAKEEEEILIAMNKKGKEDLLKALSEDESKANEKLLMEQKRKDKEMDYKLTALANEEQEANDRVTALLQMNDRSKNTEQIMDEMEKERIAMENLVKISQEDAENLRKKEVLESMNALLQSDQVQEKVLRDYQAMRSAATTEALQSALDETKKIDAVLNEKDKDHSELIKNLANEELAQREAFHVLQLQTDEKHQRITNQLELLERELQELSFLEIERKQERQEDDLNRLEANRQALTDLFVQLIEERQRREEELAKRLVELEERREGEIEDYWLIQFQRLMDQKPETLIVKEDGCDEMIAQILAEASAQDYISNFARNKISWQILRDMKDEDLKQIGIHEYGVRWRILKAVQTKIEEEDRAAAKTKRLESETGNDSVPVVQTVKPSAPPLPVDSIEVHEESPCVICMEAKRDVIFLVCGHVCCCSGCSTGLKECPICRQTIVKTVKMFMV